MRYASQPPSYGGILAYATLHSQIQATDLLGYRLWQGSNGWQSCITSLALGAAEALSPSAMAATGIKDPRHFVKARREPTVSCCT